MSTMPQITGVLAGAIIAGCIPWLYRWTARADGDLVAVPTAPLQQARPFHADEAVSQVSDPDLIAFVQEQHASHAPVPPIADRLLAMAIRDLGRRHVVEAVPMLVGCLDVEEPDPVLAQPRPTTPDAARIYDARTQPIDRLPAYRALATMMRPELVGPVLDGVARIGITTYRTLAPLVDDLLLMVETPMRLRDRIRERLVVPVPSQAYANYALTYELIARSRASGR